MNAYFQIKTDLQTYFNIGIMYVSINLQNYLII